MTFPTELPQGYRWATEIEMDDPEGIMVRRGGPDDSPWVDIAIPLEG